MSRVHVPPDWLILTALLVGAAAIRVWGVGWSLPYVIHPDEPNIVDAGVRILKSGNPNPQWFHYPSLVIYLQTAIYQLNLWWGTWRGYYSGPAALPDHNYIFALAPDLYLWGRAATALIGAGVVAATYALGRALLGRAAGLVAALLLLTAPVHVEQSHYLVTDVVMGACGLGVLAAAWWLAQRPGWRPALLAGALVGACAGAKYNGAYTALVPAIAWGLPILDFRFSILDRRRKTSHLAGPNARAVLGEIPNPKSKIQNPKWLGVGFGMAGAAVAGFLITNPFVVLDWPHWIKGFEFEYNDYQAVSSLAGMGPPLGSYLDMLWTNERWIVLPALLGVLLLVIDAWRTREARLVRLAWLLIPFPPLYVVLMSRFERTFERNLIVILPFLGLLAGYGAVRLLGGLAARLPRSAPRAVRQPALLAGLVGLALAAEPGREMINFDRYLAGPDSRLTAFAWVVAQARAGHRAAIEMHPLLACAPAPWTCPDPDIYAPLDQLTKRSPAWYADHGYDYVVLVGKETAVLEEPSVSGPRDPAQLAPYLALPEVQHFAGDGEGGKGPPVYVYQTTPAGVHEMKGITPNGARFGDMAELWGSARRPLATPHDPWDPADSPPPPPDTPYTPGGAIGLHLYWRSLVDGTPSTPRWTVAVHLVNAAHAVAAQVDVEPISHDHLQLVRAWRQGEFLDGAYNVPLPPTLPPGTYRLLVSLYDPANGSALPVIRPSAPPPAPDLDLGAILVQP